nr:PREDICTED: multiple epidermal growth factor-like domains protein 8 [Latimeria chalumnae]|eukprot:XP_014339547.1 PREDICTED: multiple epidermal growth factor-like domains protein 8 [Latimeria chalumnae]
MYLMTSPAALSSNYRIILTFTFMETECTYDYLFVYDGDSKSSPLLASLSGNTLPEPIEVTSSKVNPLERNPFIVRSASRWVVLIACIRTGKACSLRSDNCLFSSLPQMLLHLFSDANYNLLRFNATYVFSLCPLACSGNRVCETLGHCTCSTGWHGDSCNIRDCSSYCVLHGVCIEETQRCQCDMGFVGHSRNLSLNNNQGAGNWYEVSASDPKFAAWTAAAGAFLNSTNAFYIFGETPEGIHEQSAQETVLQKRSRNAFLPACLLLAGALERSLRERGSI